jgi:hypothetical protein
MPKDEPMAPNPPAGAVIDYVVGPATSGPVALRILDPKGALVRRYASDDRRPGRDLAKLRVAPEWVDPAAAPAATPGMHRFVWSLRYPAPISLAEGDAYADGVWAPPGRYTVEVSAGDVTKTQPLTVSPDPRLPLTDDVYARELALARRVEGLLARVAAAVLEADSTHRRLAAAGPAALDLDVQSLAGPDFGLAASAAPPAGLTSLRVLSGQLRTLLAAVDGADAPPSPDAEAGIVSIEPAVEATLAAWRALMARVPPAPGD